MLYIKKIKKNPEYIALEFSVISVIEGIILIRDIDATHAIINDIKLILSNSVVVDDEGYPLCNEYNSDTYIRTTYPFSSSSELFVELSDTSGFSYLYCGHNSCQVVYNDHDRVITERYPSKEILFVLEQWLAFLETGLLTEPPLEANTIENLNELLAFWAAQPDDDARKANKLAYYEVIKNRIRILEEVLPARIAALEQLKKQRGVLLQREQYESDILHAIQKADTAPALSILSTALSQAQIDIALKKRLSDYILVKQEHCNKQEN